MNTFYRVCDSDAFNLPIGLSIYQAEYICLFELLLYFRL